MDPFIGMATRGNSTLAEIVTSWGMFGPALAGILITRFITCSNKDISHKKPILAFYLSLVLSASILVLNITMTSNAPWAIERIIVLFLFGLLVALPPACVLSSAFSRNLVLRHYLRSLIKFRGSVVYYLIALLLNPFSYWLGSVLSDIFGQGAYYAPPPLTGWYALRVISITFLNQFFYGNTLGEEVGWRRFALPRLQVRFSPLIASLIIAGAWFPWHLPLKWGNPDVIPYLFYALSFVPSSIFLTWIYNRTHGSILAVGIAHVMGNVSGKIIFPITDFRLIIGFFVAIILIFTDRMLEKRADVNTSDHFTGQEQEIVIPPLDSA